LVALRIDPDVKLKARFFGIDAALIQAVVNAEGNILRAVQCSVPTVTTREKAIEITCRSAVHAMSDFLVNNRYDKAGPEMKQQFIEYWAQRWAPRGVANDPTDLNKNWPVNVLHFWRKA
jgi:hypothetical protein